MAPSPWLVGLLFGAGALLGAACTGLQQTTESDSDSDSSVDCPIGSLNCRCTSAGTCDPGLVCASETCTPGSDETGDADPTTGVTATTDVEESSGSSSDAAECDPGGDGSADPACPGTRPYCTAGACVDCQAIACAEVPPNLPVCDADTGLCAACDCDDSSPVCDAETHTCSACTDHAECPDSACDLWSGACFPVAGALWVDGAGQCDDAGTGAENDPLCTLGEAFARVQMAPTTAHAVRVRPHAYTIEAALAVPVGGKVALVHATGGDGVEIAAPTSQAITVGTDGALIVDGVAITGAESDGLTCAAGKLWLDRLVVANAGGHGIFSDDCDLGLRRSVLTGNHRSGVTVKTAEVRIENSYISNNGNNEDGGGGVFLAGGASLTAVYTTLIGNLGVAGVSWSVACNVEPDDPAIEKVDVRNSVAINLGTKTLCDGATVKTTAWSTIPDDAGASNLAIQYDELADYLTEDAGIAGVYRALEGTALDQLAKWESGDPDIDFDGDPRPSGANSPDFAGAIASRRESGAAVWRRHAGFAGPLACCRARRVAAAAMRGTSAGSPAWSVDLRGVRDPRRRRRIPGRGPAKKHLARRTGRDVSVSHEVCTRCRLVDKHDDAGNTPAARPFERLRHDHEAL